MWTVEEAASDENEVGVLQTANCEPKMALNTTAKLETSAAADTDLCTIYLQPSASSTMLFSTDEGPREMLKPVLDQLAPENYGSESCEDRISQLSKSLSCFQLSPSKDIPLLREQEEIDISTLNLCKAFVPQSHDLVTLTSHAKRDDGKVACMLEMHGGNGDGIQSTENEISETFQSKANICASLNCIAVHCDLEASENVQPPLESDLSSESATHISPQIPPLDINGSIGAAFSKVLAVAQSDHVINETSKVDTSILHLSELEDEDLYVHDLTEELKVSLDISQLCTFLASSPDITKGSEVSNFSRIIAKVDGIPFMESTSSLSTTYSESCPSNTVALEGPSLIPETQDLQSSFIAGGDLQKTFTSNLLQVYEDGSSEHSLNKVDTAKDRCFQEESNRQHLLQLKENDLQTMTPHTESRSASSCTDLLENGGETELAVKEERDIHNYSLPLGDKNQSLVFAEEQKAGPSVHRNSFPSSTQSRLSAHEAEVETWTVPLSCGKISSMSPVLSSTAMTWVTPIMLVEQSMNTSAPSEDIRCGMLSPMSQRNVCTNITPVTSSCAVTWVTPIALLEKSMNTSGDFSITGKREACAKDSVAETDSLLWNFSRENLNSMSRTELENRLENMLIIIEVLSRQLQDWQCKQGLMSHLGPSEQRDSFTQTDVTHATEEEKYHYNLYVRAMEKINLLQNSLQDEERLKEELQKASESLKSLYATSVNTFEFAKKIYQSTQEEKRIVSQDVCRMGEFMSRQTVVQRKINETMQDCVLQQDEMKSQREEAIRAKEAADKCLEDFKIHSSSVISQLRLDLESEKDLCAALKEAYEQQLIYQKECMEFSQNCKSLCSSTKENQFMLQQKCKEMRNLLTRHCLVMEKMSSKMQATVEEHTTIQMEMEHAVSEKEKVCTELQDTKMKNEQIMLESTWLAAELTSLMENLAEMRASNEQYMTELSVQNTSIKVLEQALAEEKERQKQLLSETLKQKHELQERICQLGKQRSLFEGELKKYNEQIDDLQSQLAVSAKNRELIDEENYVCREQLIEMEKELKSSFSLIRESKLQCEEQKDIIQQLQKDRETLQEELDSTKAEARDMLLKMGKEISDSFKQVTLMKEKLLDLSGSLKAALLEEDLAISNSVIHNSSNFAIHTPTSSFVGSVLKAAQRDAESDNEEEKSDGLMSEKSAFTKVQPTTPKTADFEVSLPDILSELRGIITTLSITASQLCQNKTQEIHKLKKELSDFQDKLHNLSCQYTIELHDLKEEITNLKVQKESQCKILNLKEQSVKQLQEITQAQEKKCLQLLQERRDTENLYCEISQLKRSLQLLETEKSVLQDELGKCEETSRRDWLQERILVQKEVNKLRLLYLEAEDSKSEIIARTTRHRETLEVNLCRSEKEVKKLDDLLERIRKALLSVPEVVASCQELKEMMDFLG